MTRQEFDITDELSGVHCELMRHVHGLSVIFQKCVNEHFQNDLTVGLLSNFIDYVETFSTDCLVLDDKLNKVLRRSGVEYASDFELELKNVG